MMTSALGRKTGFAEKILPPFLERDAIPDLNGRGWAGEGRNFSFFPLPEVQEFWESENGQHRLRELDRLPRFSRVPKAQDH